jgi:surface polysaccharide O-acyltransferase-like enzyme
MRTHESWIDVLRIAATCMVLVLHLCIRPLEQYGVTDGFNWYAAVIIRNITTVSVPLFFMMSGYLYLQKDSITIATFLKKRCVLIIVPFFVWSYIFTLQPYIMQGAVPPLSVIKQPFIQPAMFHLWFMYPLIALYLCVPLIHAMCRNLNDDLARYALILWVGFSGVVGYGMSFQLFPSAFQPQFISAIVGYFIAGCMIIRFHFKPAYLVLLILVIMLVMIIGTIHSTNQQHPVFSAFYELTVAHVMVLSLAVFWLCYHYRDKMPDYAWLRYASHRCYFVYFVHPLFIMLVNQHVMTSAAHLPYYYFPYAAIMVIAGSFGAACVAHHLRLGKIMG